ncbi:MAG: hypothetical protein H6Q14_1540 [Bacteroidetes bacterium]|nr:hypothetical protein [Bacteroidota bacterium]
MEKLNSLTASRLQNLEFVQFVRDTVNDVTGTNVSLLTQDVPLGNYLNALTAGVDKLELAVRNPKKNPFTEQLIQKDQARDTAFIRFGRRLSYFELSNSEVEQKAYNTLSILWNLHRNTPRLNYQAQTSATDNLLSDLLKEPYASALGHIDMQTEVNALKATNDEFRILSSDKRAGIAEADFVSAKELRASLSISTNSFNGYVDSMASAYSGNAEWEKIVKAMNVVRNRYADLLARRTSPGKATPETPVGG